MEMKNPRFKKVTISLESRKLNASSSEDVCSQEVVFVSKIKDWMRYYSGVLFVTSIVARFCQCGILTTTADAGPCPVVWSEWYGTMFEVVAYNANRNHIPMIFYHFIGTECDNNWRIVCRLSK